MFPRRLERLLRDKKWVRGFQLLPEGELVELMGYLENVRFIPTPT